MAYCIEIARTPVVNEGRNKVVPRTTLTCINRVARGTFKYILHETGDDEISRQDTPMRKAVTPKSTTSNNFVLPCATWPLVECVA